MQWTTDEAQLWVGHPLSFRKDFPAGEDKDGFDAYNGAVEWLRAKGFEVGSMDRHCPVGVAKNCDYIAKWTNINYWDRKLLDGLILPHMGGFRGGGATILLKEDPG